MAKKKDAKAKLPKTIAGVSIPKHLRNAVEPVLRFAGNPMVSDVLAGVLVAGAEQLLGDKGKGKSVGKGSNPVGLLLAVAAGEIASHIVAAYQAAPKRSPKPARSNSSAKPGGARATGAKRKKNKVPAA